MPVGASNKSRIAQRFAQLLTMTTCVSSQPTGKHVKVHVNQIINNKFYNTALVTLLETRGSEWSYMVGRLDKPANCW